ncbi:16S rRNA (uracil(1498)-N(3))-methyltransferase [Saccharobesus litoralis]|uniref:Ribosomal RNA small subunit methyltransferase E n=1 Tax=Saccharobesus litoralis TaxID=2172099 RepID=A0A2S0VMF0_9ALTE|nr:16S rRNA (uracil(1498)-N(3))-methyltransferase [Saccharobesus litoralis]AWB65280.1 16S rRNA (uracil(1498)-N(3))-methyltransferase [Saccharobesus litoralis]
MRIPRIYHPNLFETNQTITLSDDAANHVGRVLRMKPQQQIVLFNGDGCDYECTLTEVSRKKVLAHVDASKPLSNESPLAIHLGQVISRGDRMEFTIQKSVELGVSEITPLYSERCGVKLNAERLAKKVEQWQKVVISACEQSGRAKVPTVNPVIELDEWLAKPFSGTRVNLHPYANQTMNQLDIFDGAAQLLIGPEGGLSDEEISAADAAGFKNVLMGPRILRTETAALAALSMLQCLYGDL